MKINNYAADKGVDGNTNSSAANKGADVKINNSAADKGVDGKINSLATYTGANGKINSLATNKGAEGKINNSAADEGVDGKINSSATNKGADVKTNNFAADKGVEGKINNSAAVKGVDGKIGNCATNGKQNTVNEVVDLMATNNLVAKKHTNWNPAYSKVSKGDKQTGKNGYKMVAHDKKFLKGGGAQTKFSISKNTAQQRPNRSSVTEFEPCTIKNVRVGNLSQFSNLFRSSREIFIKNDTFSSSIAVLNCTNRAPYLGPAFFHPIRPTMSSKAKEEVDNKVADRVANDKMEAINPPNTQLSAKNGEETTVDALKVAPMRKSLSHAFIKPVGEGEASALNGLASAESLADVLEKTFRDDLQWPLEPLGGTTLDEQPNPLSKTSTGPPICTTEAVLATKENNDRANNRPHEHVKLREPCQKSVKHFGMDSFDIWKATRANECANALSCPTAGRLILLVLSREDKITRKIKNKKNKEQEK